MRTNGVMMQYFEWFLPDDGNLWNRLRDDVSHLRDIGVTSVWIPPCYKGLSSTDVGYSAYDLYDLGEFDQKGTVRTKYGTKQELHDCIQSLHDNGIAVYADVVLNHKGGGDELQTFRVVEVDPHDRNRAITEPYEIEGFTRFTFPGRGGKYSDFEWNWEHFSATDYNHRDNKDAIYIILGDYYGIGGEDPRPGMQWIIDQLLDVRRDFAYGDQEDYFDHEHVVGWVRRGDEHHPDGCVVIMSNAEGGVKPMFVGTDYAGSVWHDQLGHIEEEVVIGDDGRGWFPVGDGSISVYLKD